VRVLDVAGVRVVARPDALDRARWQVGPDGGLESAEARVFRLAPDEAFGLVGITGTVSVEDPDAISVAEPGFFLVELSADEFSAVIEPHVEWSIPSGPAFVQGAIANVPARILLDADGGAVVLIAKAHEHEFRTRIGIRP
jgi:hypothetical protein